MSEHGEGSQVSPPSSRCKIRFRTESRFASMAFDVMSSWSFVQASSSSAWRLVLSRGELPWWKSTAGGRSGDSSPNKLESFPDLEDLRRLVPFVRRCRGDGDRKWKRWSASLFRLGLCIFSSVLGVELRRPLELPVSDASPVTFLAEGRPGEAMLASFLPPGLMPFERQLFNFNMESSSSIFVRRWSSGGPVISSGHVPGDGRTGSTLELSIGPDCNLNHQDGVLLVSFNDYDVISFSFQSWYELCTAAADS